MKKFTALMLSLALLFACFLPATAEEKKISVVATIFPVYDWAREVIGDSANVELTLLQDSGVDLHSYQPTIQDIAKVSTSDVFVYVGGESDEWVKDALANSVNKDMKVVNLVESMGEDIKMEEIVEGMEHEHHHDHDDDDEDEDHDHDHEHEDEDEDHDHDHEDADHDHEEHDHDHEDEDHDHDHEDEDEDHEHHHDHDHEHEDEADEHVWLSLRNAQKLTAAIAAALCEADPANADTYKANAAAYIEKLAALDAQYEEAISKATYKTVLFGDRFPFRYLVDDYGLTYYAAFSGCSAESEASFATVIFLANKVDELNLPAVLTIENPKTRIAETIIGNTAAKNQKILSLDSMQGTTAADVQAGTTYLSVMENNLKVLTEALQ